MNMMYVRDAQGSLEETGQRLEAAVKAHQFGVIGVIDLQAKMHEKGVDFGPACRIYEVCNPHKAKEVLENDMRISTALPCRISLYEEDGRTRLATMLPSAMLGMFGADDLSDVADEVEAAIRSMIDDATV
jgi:uncharacterized protein (DUF302 family)